MSEQAFAAFRIVKRLAEEVDDCRSYSDVVTVMRRGLKKIVALEADEKEREAVMRRFGDGFHKDVALEVAINRIDDTVGRPMGRG